MHEIRATRAAADAPSHLRSFSGESLQIGMLQWLEHAQRIEIRFQIAPPSKRIESPLSFCSVGGLACPVSRGPLDRFCCLGRLFFCKCRTVCHESVL